MTLQGCSRRSRPPEEISPQKRGNLQAFRTGFHAGWSHRPQPGWQSKRLAISMAGNFNGWQFRWPSSKSRRVMDAWFKPGGNHGCCHDRRESPWPQCCVWPRALLKRANRAQKEEGETPDNFHEINPGVSWVVSYDSYGLVLSNS